MRQEVREMRIVQLQDPKYRLMPLVRNLNNQALAASVTKKSGFETSVQQIRSIVQDFNIYRREHVSSWREELQEEADKRTLAGETVDYGKLNANQRPDVQIKSWVREEEVMATKILKGNSRLPNVEQAAIIQKALGTKYPRTIQMILVSVL